MPDTRPLLERIDHVNIVVDDMDAMARFYREVLGMEQHRTATIEGEWVDRLVGLPGTVADVVFLRLDQGTNLELIQYRSPAGERPPRLATPNSHGLRHMAFRVRDIDAACDALRRAGVEFVSAVQEVPTEQVPYAGSRRKRLAYFHDPEGNLLELCSYGD